MLPIAGQTAGPIGLKFFVDTHGWPGGDIGKKKIENFFFKIFSDSVYICRYHLYIVQYIYVDFAVPHMNMRSGKRGGFKHKLNLYKFKSEE